MAQGFDPKALELRGEPVPLGDSTTGTEASTGPIASTSWAGSVAYGTFRVGNRRLAWVDLSGREIEPIPLEPGPYSLPLLSPDDRRLLLARTESAGASGLWIADLERGVVTRFTDEPGLIEAAAWSPDGTRIAYMRSENSPQVLRVKSLVGDPTETYLDSDPLHGSEAEMQGGSEFRLGAPREFATFPEEQRDMTADHSWERLLALFPAEKDPTRSITIVLDALPGASGR